MVLRKISARPEVDSLNRNCQTGRFALNRCKFNNVHNTLTMWNHICGITNVPSQEVQESLSLWRMELLTRATWAPCYMLRIFRRVKFCIWLFYIREASRCQTELNEMINTFELFTSWRLHLERTNHSADELLFDARLIFKCLVVWVRDKRTLHSLQSHNRSEDWKGN